MAIHYILTSQSITTHRVQNLFAHRPFAPRVCTLVLFIITLLNHTQLIVRWRVRDNFHRANQTFPHYLKVCKNGLHIRYKHQLRLLDE